MDQHVGEELSRIVSRHENSDVMGGDDFDDVAGDVRRCVENVSCDPEKLTQEIVDPQQAIRVLADNYDEIVGGLVDGDVVDGLIVSLVNTYLNACSADVVEQYAENVDDLADTLTQLADGRGAVDHQENPSSPKHTF